MQQKRVRVLEKIAGAIYREWFVHFRFPGYEKAGMVSSMLGPIPKNWEVRSLLDFCEFVRGVEPGSENYTKDAGEGRIRFLRVGDLSKRDSAIYAPKNLVGDKVLMPKDIAITLDGSLGLVRIGLNGGYSTGIRKVVIHDRRAVGWSFAYHLLGSESIQAVIHAHAKGTTIKHAGTAVEHMYFANPPVKLIEEFERITSSILEQVLVLENQIENLRRTRDLLLPRLLSGQINVNHMESVV